MKTPVFFLAVFVLSTISVALACRCRSHTAAANIYLRNCVTAIISLVVSSQPVSDISTCQDERLGDNRAYADNSVLSSEVVFLSDKETFAATVTAVSDAVFFYDGEYISQIAEPTITFSQRMNCWWQSINIFSPCNCSCSY
jgi:hypothetical protein